MNANQHLLEMKRLALMLLMDANRATIAGRSIEDLTESEVDALLVHEAKHLEARKARAKPFDVDTWNAAIDSVLVRQ